MEKRAASATAVAVGGRRRFIWGASLLAGTAAVSALTAITYQWAIAHSRERLAFLGMSEWHFILAGVFLCGAAAVVGFIMLAGPVLDRIRHTWTRWIANAAAFFLVLGAILVWLFMLVMFVLMAGMSANFKVESPGGSSVVVEQGVFDPDDYDVYRQKSGFVYTWAARTRTSRYEKELKDCALADGESELVLTCGSHVVVVPR